MKSKVCTKCGEEKAISEFYKRNDRKCGVISKCKACSSNDTKIYRRTKDGFISQIYSDQLSSSKNRNFHSPTYTKQELKDWLFSQGLFHRLYNIWIKSGFVKKLRPSCDRLNDYDGYSLDNLQLITWGNNERKGHDDRLNGINNKMSKAVISTNKITRKETEYYSISQASRKIGASQGNISSCCSGRIKSLVGCYWRFKT